MKKAKIILTAIGILAVVGGALAFKARFNSTPVWELKNVPQTTYSVTVGTRVYTLITNQVCVTTTPFFTNGGINRTTVSTNGLSAVAHSGGLTTPIPNIFTSCIDVPNTLTTSEL